ncbi:unnamed protein product, partial [Ectocarpus fasciculatus]
ICGHRGWPPLLPLLRIVVVVCWYSSTAVVPPVVSNASDAASRHKAIPIPYASGHVAHVLFLASHFTDKPWKWKIFSARQRRNLHTTSNCGWGAESQHANTKRSHIIPIFFNSFLWPTPRAVAGP